jgi:hypothetical protein
MVRSFQIAHTSVMDVERQQARCGLGKLVVELVS